MDEVRPDQVTKGRGAVSNATGRYEAARAVAVDDGWQPDDDLPPRRTTVTIDAARSIIARNNSPDIPFDQSINPYRGCEHGCVYCYARPTHAYGGLSPGLDFETKLFAKKDAARLLEAELRRPGYRCRTIVLGANTDPYQPIERTYRISRQILEVLAAYEHPVSIITKSALVVRDLDILTPMAERGLAEVRVSVTTLDGGLARKMEPRAAAPHRRLETIRRLSAAGVPTGVMAAPIIPFLNDAELERILEAAAAAGAEAAGYVLLRLPLEIKDLFAEWLATHVPGKAKHVLNQIRDSRGGRLNSAEFGSRMRGSGPQADLLAKRFRLACRRYGLNVPDRSGFSLDTRHFRPPPKAGDQLSFL